MAYPTRSRAAARSKFFPARIGETKTTDRCSNRKGDSIREPAEVGRIAEDRKNKGSR